MPTIKRWHGKPDFSKSDQLRLESIPKFGATALDTVGIGELIRKLADFVGGQLESTRYYALLTRLTGLVETQVTRWMKEGKPYGETANLLKERYSPKPEEQLAALAKSKQHDYNTTEHFITAFQYKIEEIRQGGGVVDAHRLMSVLLKCVPQALATRVARGTRTGAPDIDAVLEEIRALSSLFPRETWSNAVSRPQSSFQGNPQQPRAPTPSKQQYPWKRADPPRCYNCNQIGHMAAECPIRRSPAQSFMRYIIDSDTELSSSDPVKLEAAMAAMQLARLARVSPRDDEVRQQLVSPARELISECQRLYSRHYY